MGFHQLLGACIPTADLTPAQVRLAVDGVAKRCSWHATLSRHRQPDAIFLQLQPELGARLSFDFDGFTRFGSQLAQHLDQQVYAVMGGDLLWVNAHARTGRVKWKESSGEPDEYMPRFPRSAAKVAARLGLALAKDDDTGPGIEADDFPLWRMLADLPGQPCKELLVTRWLDLQGSGWSALGEFTSAPPTAALPPAAAAPPTSTRLEELLLATAQGHQGGPGDTSCHIGLALEYGQLGRMEDALRVFSVVRAGDPDHLSTYSWAAALLQDANRHQEAQDWLSAGMAQARRLGNQREADRLAGELRRLTR